MSRHISHLSNGSWVSKESSTFSARLCTWGMKRPPRLLTRSTASSVRRQASGEWRELNRPKVTGRPVSIASELSRS